MSYRHFELLYILDVLQLLLFLLCIHIFTVKVGWHTNQATISKLVSPFLQKLLQYNILSHSESRLKPFSLFKKGNDVTRKNV